MPDRCDILQDGHTIVVRLSDTLVARIVADADGPRIGTEWFARETSIAAHLTSCHAPVIPLHPDLPPVAHEHDGFTMNFWQFVTALDHAPKPEEIGKTLHHCHDVLRSFPDSLPSLAILHESLRILDSLSEKQHFSLTTIALLRNHIIHSIGVLTPLPQQALHGDAHMGNLMMTTQGLLWTDWEDAFSGPIEWDLASVIWNAKLLENDNDIVEKILAAYKYAGGYFDQMALQQCLIARAAVMSTWYPILYPNPSPDRVAKLQHRLDWLAANQS